MQRDTLSYFFSRKNSLSELLENSDDGALFSDGVHRLKGDGKEKLFIYRFQS